MRAAVEERTAGVQGSVQVGHESPSPSVSYTSPDGITWTSHDSATPLGAILTFGAGVFRRPILASTDGVTWSSAPVPAIPGEQAGFGSGIAVAAYGGTAGWVGARSFYTQVTVRGGGAFMTHP